ncbi:MAG TPA: TerC family protein [Patescibacteria group bacterium]|nr:TerC family protein [Patescibacteria group bacterium]
MPAPVAITYWHWIGFICTVLILLGLDLGFFHRRAHTVGFKESLLWTSVWVSLALLFALGLKSMRGQTEALQFLTGYLIELSVSMDNVFVMALIFAHFAIPPRYQHRVLFWGIVGALIMRGTMIGVSIEIISLLDWVLYVLGALLVFSGFKMLLTKSEVEPEKSWVIRWARRVYPVSPNLDGQHFVTTWEGKRALTPLALVLLLIEATDLVFALDSIPAVFAVTTKPFIVFTSNVFAILGLRSLYFVLAGAIGYFRFLKYGLSVVLIFIGVKMLLDPNDRKPMWFQVDIPISISLLVVAGIILTSILVSLVAAWRENLAARKLNQARTDTDLPSDNKTERPGN